MLYPIRICSKTLKSLGKMLKKKKKKNHSNQYITYTKSEYLLTTDIKVWTLLYLLYR